MKTSEQIRLYNLILSGFLYGAMTLIVPMASGGQAQVAYTFAPITAFVTFFFSLVYYLLIKKQKTKLAAVFFWIVISLVVGFTLLSYPYR